MKKLMKDALQVFFVFLIMAVFIPSPVRAMEGDNLYIENPGYQGIVTTDGEIETIGDIDPISEDIEPINDEFDRSQYARDIDPIAEDAEEDDTDNTLLIVIGAISAVAIVGVCYFIFKKKD